MIMQRKHVTRFHLFKTTLNYQNKIQYFISFFIIALILLLSKCMSLN